MEVLTHSLSAGYLEARTENQPIMRVYAVEELWPKKFNTPDHLWARLHSEPKDQQSYFNVRIIMEADGRVVETHPPWLVTQTINFMAENPRLKADAWRNQPFFAVPGSSNPGSGGQMVNGSLLGN